MKKIILLIAITLSLNANEIICQMSTDKYLKHYQLLEFAHERKDMFQVYWHTKASLMNLERIIVNCPLDDRQMAEAKKQRKGLMKVLAAVKKVK